jgi:hypothetical protein
MMPPPVSISRFITTPFDPDDLIRSKASMDIPADIMKDLEPSWSPPTSGKWVIGYKQDGGHVMMIKVRWIQEREEYVSIDNQRQNIYSWSVI